MKTQNKKGFTIVELVIVIAVIAILAAVLIPTFINLTKKANESADIQACRQMNTQLAINEVLKGKSITEVHAALKSGGMDTENYTPLVEGHYFFWDSKLNRILYMDAKNNVLYPEEYKGTTGAEGQRLSLNGKIGMTEVTPGDGGVYTISTAEQLYWLSEKKRETKNAVQIKFTVDKIDLKGADIGFQFSNGNKDTAFTCTIVGNGEGGTTLYGLAQITNAYIGTANVGDNAGKAYGCGFVQLVEGKVNITIKNLTIANSTVGNLEIGGVGAVVGKSQAKDGNNPTVTLEGVTVKDSVINGRNKVGGLIGNVGSTVLRITDCRVENVTVNCSEGQGGKVIGAIYGGDSKLTIDKAFSPEWVKNSTVNLVKGAVERDTKKAEVSYKTNDGKATIPIASGTLLVRKYNMKDGKLIQAAEYRMFNQNAYMSVEITNCGGKFEYKIGSVLQKDVTATTHEHNKDKTIDGRYAKVDENKNMCFPCWIVTQ